MRFSAPRRYVLSRLSPRLSPHEGELAREGAIRRDVFRKRAHGAEVIKSFPH